MMNQCMTPADIAAVTGNANNSNGWGGDWSSWIIIFLIFAMFGFGGNGFRNNAAGISENYVLSSDFATIQRQMSDGFSGVEKGIDTIRNGLCDGFYNQAQMVNGVNMNIAQNGYESRLATQNLGSQMSQCCCDIREGISGVNYNMATNTNGVQRQIERGFSETNYNMATNNCATLTAIDKVGDRIIDYLAAEKAQNLRDENQALRLAASQQQQNNYLISQLRPCPQPAYITCNPWAASYGNGCCNG